MANPLVSGLAIVRSGWTGSISVTVGASTVTHTPTDPTSAAEVMVRLAQRASRAFGAAWEAFPTEAGVLTLSASAAFTLAASGTTAARTGFASGPYASATERPADGAHEDGIYPSVGLTYSGSHLVGQTRATAMATGAAATMPVRGDSAGTLIVHGAHAELVALQATLEGGALTYDVWSGGRLEGRVRIGQARREARSQKPGMVQLAIDCREVTA